MIDQEMRLILVAHDATDAEIRSLVRQAAKIAMDSDRPFYLSIGGHDADSRELWQIPEAAELCKRLAQNGMLSALHLGDPFNSEPTPGLTALQLWTIATDRIADDGTCEITEPVYRQFCQDVLCSNEIADSIPPDDGEVFVLKS